MMALQNNAANTGGSNARGGSLSQARARSMSAGGGPGASLGDKPIIDPDTETKALLAKAHGDEQQIMDIIANAQDEPSLTRAQGILKRIHAAKANMARRLISAKNRTAYQPSQFEGEISDLKVGQVGEKIGMVREAREQKLVQQKEAGELKKGEFERKVKEDARQGAEFIARLGQQKALHDADLGMKKAQLTETERKNKEAEDLRLNRERARVLEGMRGQISRDEVEAQKRLDAMADTGAETGLDDLAQRVADARQTKENTEKAIEALRKNEPEPGGYEDSRDKYRQDALANAKVRARKKGEERKAKLDSMRERTALTKGQLDKLTDDEITEGYKTASIDNAALIRKRLAAHSPDKLANLPKNHTHDDYVSLVRNLDRFIAKGHGESASHALDRLKNFKRAYMEMVPARSKNGRPITQSGGQGLAPKEMLWPRAMQQAVTYNVNPKELWDKIKEHVVSDYGASKKDVEALGELDLDIQEWRDAQEAAQQGQGASGRQAFVPGR